MMLTTHTNNMNTFTFSGLIFTIFNSDKEVVVRVAGQRNGDFLYTYAELGITANGAFDVRDQIEELDWSNGMNSFIAAVAA